MITGFFLHILFVFISFIVSFLPMNTFPPQIGAGIALFWGYVNLFSMVLPVSTILTVLSLGLTYEATKLGWKLFHWVLRRIRH